MILVQDTVISDDIKNKLFVCDLEKCKGACCVEGELGAPLDKEELQILDEIYPKVEPYLTEEAKNEISKQGKWIEDYEGDYSTPTINDRECVYAFYDEKKILKCGIEQAYLDNKIDYKKPISCHLYPVRLKQYNDFIAVNYSEWNICSDACNLGESLGVPLYKFLKEPLIRKFGEGWYEELIVEIENQ